MKVDKSLQSSDGESQSLYKDDGMSSSSGQDSMGRQPQHSDSEDRSKGYRPHRTMFVSEQSHGKPPPTPPSRESSSRSSGGGHQPNISKRHSPSHRTSGDDTDPPSKGKLKGDHSSHGGEDSRSTDDSSIGDLDINSGHSYQWSSHRRSSIDSAGSRASIDSTGSGRRVPGDSGSGHSRNEIPVTSAPIKALRKSRKIDIPVAFLQKPDGDDASSTGTPRSRTKEKVSLSHFDHGDDGSDIAPLPATRSARRGGRKPKIPVPPALDPFTPETRRKIDSALSLKVDFVSVDDGEDARVVSTFNSLLGQIASSGRPQVQKALNILATMKRNDISPDEQTWDLIERCARVIGDSSGGGSSSSRFDASSDAESEYELPSRFDLYCQSPTPNIEEGGGGASRFARRSWRSQQDLSQLPPAFRLSIMAMLREANRRTTSTTSSIDSEIHASPSGSQSSGDRRLTTDSASSVSSGEGRVLQSSRSLEYKPLNSGPSVRERKKRWSSKGKDMDVSMSMPIKKESSHGSTAKDSDAEPDPEYQKHGIVKYHRPDGFGVAPRVKAAKSILKIDQTQAFDIRKEIEKLDPKSLANFHSLLQYIAESDYVDKAKQAGIVLKAMKGIPVTPDDTTRALLAECSRIHALPRERGVHEVDIEVVEERGSDATKKPKKKVRFSNQNSTRIIRRRRSISSMERWDEPLTPPKRISAPIDLAPSRFSSGLRDHRPAPPRRSDSLSSLLSGGSMASTDSDSGDDTIDTYSETSEIFKPPFVDSPAGKQRKKSPHKMDKAGAPVVARRVGGSRSHRSGDVPVTPVQRKGSILQDSSGTTDDNSSSVSPAVPPPPVMSPVFTTPPSEPRRKRRGSIGGTEYRAMAPLTPPRRVSAPLDIFIAQSSLKKLAEAKETPKETEKEKDPLASSTHSLPTHFPAKATTSSPATARPRTPDLSNSVHSSSSHGPKIGPTTTTKVVPQSPKSHAQISASWKVMNLPSRKSKKGFEMDTIESTSTSFDSADSPPETTTTLRDSSPSVGGSSLSSSRLSPLKSLSKEARQQKAISPRAVKPKANPRPERIIKRVSSLVISDRPPSMSSVSSMSPSLARTRMSSTTTSNLNIPKVDELVAEQPKRRTPTITRVSSLTTRRRSSLTNMSSSSEEASKSRSKVRPTTTTSRRQRYRQPSI